MRHLTLVFIFLFSLVLKVSAAAAAKVELNVSKQSVVRELSEDPGQPRVQSEPIEVSEAVAVPAPSPIPVPVPAPSPIPPEGNEILAPAPAETPVAKATTIQNTGNIAAEKQAAPAVAYGRYAGEDASSVLTVHDHADNYLYRVRLTPMVGGSIFANGWSTNIVNRVTFGLGLEVPVSYLTSLELEGGYGRYAMAYGNGYSGLGHDFGQANLGGNLKFYLTKNAFRPYFGAGLMGLHYHNMYSSQNGGYYYNQTLGAGQLIAGADIPVSEGISIGARGAWIVPIFNRAQVASDQFGAPIPGFEEAAAMNNSFFKILGSISFAL